MPDVDGKRGFLARLFDGPIRVPAMVAALVTVALNLAGVAPECAAAVQQVLLAL